MENIYENPKLNLILPFRQLCKKEERYLAELQDVRDQSELLEFRVLELEEGQNKVIHSIIHSSSHIEYIIYKHNHWIHY